MHTAPLELEARDRPQRFGSVTIMVAEPHIRVGPGYPEPSHDLYLLACRPAPKVDSLLNEVSERW